MMFDMFDNRFSAPSLFPICITVFGTTETGRNFLTFVNSAVAWQPGMCSRAEETGRLATKKVREAAAAPHLVKYGNRLSAAEHRAQDVDALVLEAHVALTVAGADDDDLGADAGALVEMLDILVHHADAAGRHVEADRPGLVGAVDAEDRVAAALVEIHGAGAERIVDAAFLHDRQDVTLGGFAAAHFRRRTSSSAILPCGRS